VEAQEDDSRRLGLVLSTQRAERRDAFDHALLSKGAVGKLACVLVEEGKRPRCVSGMERGHARADEARFGLERRRGKR